MSQAAQAPKPSTLNEKYGVRTVEAEVAPPPEDSFENFNAPAQPTPGLGAFVIRVGKKYAGQTLEQVGKDGVRDFATNTHRWFMDEKKPISEDWAEFFSKAEEYCAQ